MTDTTTPAPDGHGRIDPDRAAGDMRKALSGVRVVFDGLDPDELANASARYFTASEDPRVVDLRDAVHVLGTLIRKHVPAGVQRDLAEQGLELVQMRANRGIFSPQLPE